MSLTQGREETRKTFTILIICSGLHKDLLFQICFCNRQLAGMSNVFNVFTRTQTSLGDNQTSFWNINTNNFRCLYVFTRMYTFVNEVFYFTCFCWQILRCIVNCMLCFLMDLGLLLRERISKCFFGLSFIDIKYF